MANCYYHSLASVAKFKGCIDDYINIHLWFDESKSHYADLRHRALRHHSFGIWQCEQLFGVTITNSDGIVVPTRLIAENHIKEDLGFIPSVSDWLKHIQPQPWMLRGDVHRISKPSTDTLTTSIPTEETANGSN